MGKKDIDQQRINDRIEEIERRLGFLLELARTEKSKFLTSHLIFTTAERDLQIAIESCMDIARHLIAQIPIEKPKRENKEMFLILAKHKIITNP